MNILSQIKGFLSKKENIFLCLLLAVGFFARLYGLSSYPYGLNQDEAFAGYEAFSILTYGTDSFGYTNPVYLTAWGSGMNALETYISVFFFSIFGVSVTSLRLGQAVLSCFSLVVFFLLLKEVFNKKTAFIGLFLLIVSPWHMMAARWALESNYNIYFLLFGLYFFIKGIKSKNNFHWIISAIMYGLSLYSYAISYIVVPLTLAGFVLYILIRKTKFNLKTAITSVFILGIMALPLILFLLVNNGFINEIVTPFISIPKLVGFRVSEINFGNLFSPASYFNLLKIFLWQNDGLIWNSTSAFGMFYNFSTPLIFLGMAKIISNIIIDVKNKSFSFNILIAIGFTASFFCNLLISFQNVNKTNSLHIYTIIFITLGCEYLLSLFNKRELYIGFFLLYTVYFTFFFSYYLTDYNSEISQHFRAGVVEAVEFVNENDFNTVQVDSSIYYSQVLFADKTDIHEYQDTVVYTNYPSSFLGVSSFSKYTFGIDYQNINKECYIAPISQYDNFINWGYTCQTFHHYLVAYV